MAAIDTNASDRALASLAMVKVNFDEHQSFVENFAPFVRHCLFHAETDVVSTPEIKDGIAEDFGLDLPHAVLKTLLKHEERRGTVKLAHGIYQINREVLADADLSPRRAEVLRQLRALVTAVSTFARSEFDREWDKDHATAILMAYLEDYSTNVLAAMVAGRELSSEYDDVTGDGYIVHRFALHAVDAEPEAFSLLEIAVKGKMLADAAYLGDGFDQTPHELGGLEVYLDGPILLWVLGYSGDEVAAPFREMVDLLKAQGAILRCFNDGVGEAQQILAAAAERVSTASVIISFYGNVVAYLLRSGKTRSDIELMSTRLEQDLLHLGIQPVERPPASTRLTTDEGRFETILKSKIGYDRNPRALSIDLDAVTAIYRLRRGKNAQALERTSAVFVTGNSGLVRASAEFFRQNASSLTAIPNCVHAAAFTTLMWLRRPLDAPDLPRQLILADAFVAMNPGPRLWKAYNAEIEKLRSAGEISDEDAHFLMLAQESRGVLMDLTLGDDEAYTEGTAIEVLRRAEEMKTADLRAEVERERSRRKEVEAVLSERYEANQRLVRGFGRLMYRVTFICLFVPAVVFTVFGAFGTFGLSGVARFAVLVIGVGLGIAGTVRGASIKSVATQVDSYSQRVALDALRRLLGERQAGSERQDADD